MEGHEGIAGGGGGGGAMAIPFPNLLIVSPQPKHEITGETVQGIICSLPKCPPKKACYHLAHERILNGAVFRSSTSPSQSLSSSSSLLHSST